MTQTAIQFLSQIPGFYANFIAFILIFTRLMAFFTVAPIFSRKDVVILFKVGFATILSFVIMGIIDIGKIPHDVPFIYLLFMNIIEGALLGLVCAFIYEAIQAAGDLANNQMSLSSASMFDPLSKVQTSLVGNLLTMLALIIFINVDGLHLMLSAFTRSFEIFPLFNPVIDLQKAIPVDYWIYLSGNVIFFGFQIVAPIIITTLAIDLILGIISKTAPQVNVFQLSFIFKPVIGCLVLLVTLPLFMRVLENYFLDHAKFF